MTGLVGLRIAVLGGDEREQEIARLAAAAGATTAAGATMMPGGSRQAGATTAPADGMTTAAITRLAATPICSERRSIWRAPGGAWGIQQSLLPPC